MAAVVFLDEAKADFSISDLRAVRHFCIAAGAIEQNTGAPYPHAVITRDGGARRLESIRGRPVPGLPVLPRRHTGWMVTEHGIWNTVDAAATWKKVQCGKSYFRAFFTDAQHGWLVVTNEQLEQTADGGVHWSALPGITNAVACTAGTSLSNMSILAIPTMA